MPKEYGTPGPRFIYPSSSTSRNLANCDPMAQLLFDRLIVNADDQGRLQGGPDLVKATCMPLIRRATPKRVAGWLLELAENDLILLYGSTDLPLIQIASWWKCQSSARRMYRSKWPPPEGWEDRVYGEGGRSAALGGALRRRADPIDINTMTGSSDGSSSLRTEHRGDPPASW